MVLFTKQAKLLLPNYYNSIMSSLCDKNHLQEINIFTKSKEKKNNAKALSYFFLSFPVWNKPSKSSVYTTLIVSVSKICGYFSVKHHVYQSKFND